LSIPIQTKNSLVFAQFIINSPWNSKIVVAVEDALVESKKNIKALGILLSANLSWSHNLDYSSARSRHVVHRLKYLQKWLTLDEMIKLVSSQYFSIIFHNAPLWIGSLDAASWKKLNSVHYRALRMLLGDFRNVMKRDEIDSITKRATPIEWANYCITSTVIWLYNQSYTRIANELRSAAYVNDRLPYRARFIDKSKLQIGRQAIKNRIGNLFSRISFNWIGELSDEIIR
jgi:hypothetical protein